jgi:hypothetical protein
MTDRELMQTALEAMEHLHRTGDTQVFDMYAAPEIIPALRERLAQPEQEPVHYGPSSSVFGLAEMILSDCGCRSDYQPLLNRVAARIMGYIDTPPAAQRQPLTDEWIHRTTVLMGFNPEWTTEIGIAHAIVRAAEAAHGIKEKT